MMIVGGWMLCGVGVWCCSYWNYFIAVLFIVFADDDTVIAFSRRSQYHSIYPSTTSLPPTLYPTLQILLHYLSFILSLLYLYKTQSLTAYSKTNLV
jgi:hypothetical protein